MNAPEGVFILFSAGPGQAALDQLREGDPDPTSVFTRTFIPILEKPDLTLVSIAKETQIAVRKLAGSIGYDQFPDYSDRVMGNFVLYPSPRQPEPASKVPSSSEAASPSGPDESQPGEDQSEPAFGSWAAIAYEYYTLSPGTIFGF